METIFINDTAFVMSAAVAEKVIAAAGDGGVAVNGGFTEDGTMVDPMLGNATAVKDPLLASWPFVIGLSSGVLLISIVLGVLLAKLRIKKGIDLYED